MKGLQKLKTINENGVLTVMLSGEIDHHSAGSTREKIDMLITKNRPQNLVLDFSEVSFMDSSGVGLVMGRYNHSKAIGCKTAVTGLKARDKKIMLMSGLAKLVEFR